MYIQRGLITVLTVSLLISSSLKSLAKDVVRPEKIVSKREVIYDKDTYSQLADLWKIYNKEFPSEDAYGNWMYAARYAGDPDFEKYLAKGIRKYPANPTLLYLSTCRQHGMEDDHVARNYLERAVLLDPDYMDPWFSLVTIYMEQGDKELTNKALRRLLEGTAISEEVMDYNYNMLTALDKNAILYTNGDNDTYPGWVLTKILNFRPDVSIVNRSLLNTEWYPGVVIEEGLPNFMSGKDLKEFRKRIIKELKNKNEPVPSGGPFGDTLMTLIIQSAAKENRPVYFSHTLYSSPMVDKYRDDGVDIGLVTLVSPLDRSDVETLKHSGQVWIEDFRTGGMDSWKLHYSKKGDAGRGLMMNYAHGIHVFMNEGKNIEPGTKLKFFKWYQQHVKDLIPREMQDEMMSMWRKHTEIKDIIEIENINKIE
ncbi:MAG: hypothetical protein P9L92_08910 [Candidatus Electryonea clarkiae]|nr:hypothetical protein [Candidatus Electryonea clarkiae]MDP8285902.1 hypothetical protein [Candidatus Electryonea clarkiae]